MRTMIRILAILLALLLAAAPAMAFESHKRGDKGEAVKELQTRLNDLGYAVGTPDGIFGKKSEEAVKSFQKDQGLEATGVVDEATWELLFSDAGADTGAGEMGEATIDGVVYERIPGVIGLIDLMDPIMKYVDPAADATKGMRGNVCVNMYYGMKIMQWYHYYLDAADQNNLAQAAAAILQDARAGIIVHSLDEGVKEQYPEMREKFAAALSAARLSMDESAKPYLDEMGIAPGENWMEAEFGLMEKATMDGFDAILNQ